MNGGDARGVPYTAYHTFDEFTFYNDSSGLKKEIPRPDFSYQPFAMNVSKFHSPLLAERYFNLKECWDALWEIGLLLNLDRETSCWNWI